jgi:hypothetical protein
MKILFHIILLFSIQLYSQSKHPDEIRKEVYESILLDINNTKKDYPDKLIYLDNTINKFDYVDLLSVDLVLSDPKYFNNKHFCNQLFNVKCVDKIEIDQYKLVKVFKEHKDLDYPDFYGIYAPTDHWYQLVYQILNNNLKNDSKIEAEVVIPVRNIYFKKGVPVDDLYIYKYSIDENFKIINKGKLKL